MITENDLDKLRTLQQVFTEKIRLEHYIQEAPKQLGALEEAHNRTKKVFIEKNQEYEKVKNAEEEARANLREAEAAGEKAELTISKINSAREYEALDKERLAAKINETNYRKEVLQKERMLLELDEQIKQHAALIEQFEKDLTERRAGIETDVAEKKKQANSLMKQEKKLTEDLDSEVVFKFERIIKNKKEGIVAIKGNVCMGCHMILPAQFSNNVRKFEEYVFCPYCSRILYYEDAPDDNEEIFFDDEDTGALYDPEEEEEEDFEEDDKEDDKINIDFEDS